MDNFTYNYKSTNNQLLSVSDDVNNNAAKKLGDIQPGQSAENYKYDGIGNLIEDKQEEIKNIAWQANGKVKSVTRTPISTKPDLEFKYDALGQRVAKIVKPKNDNGELLPESEWEYEYYSRDAQGNVMAVYEKKYEKSGTNIFDEILSVTEFDIYGSSRIGIVNPKENKLVERRISANTNLQTKKLENITQITKLDYVFNPANISHYRGTKSYELSNHLGNVLATVSDRLIPESTDGLTVSGFKAEVVSASDYYPFGMHKPKRTMKTDKYRFGFNGQEKVDEIAPGHMKAMFWEYDSRIGRRWNQDPKPNISISNYAAFANNPIWFSDPFGDTLRVMSSSLNSEGKKWEKGQQRLELFTLDDKSDKMTDVVFNSKEYKALNPQWDAEKLDNYMPMISFNKDGILKYGAAASLTPGQLSGFINQSMRKLHSSTSYKTFGWGNLSKYNNYDHGEQGDIKGEGNLLDGYFLTVYDPTGSRPSLVRSDLIGNFVYGVVSQMHGQTFTKSRSDGDFLQSGGKDDLLDTYFLYLGHKAGETKLIPKVFDKSLVLPK